MKMIYKYKKYSLTLFTLIFCVGLIAQPTLSKEVNGVYKMDPSGELFLENKYGDVFINGWDKDSIKINIEITVKGKSLQIRLDRVEVNMNIDDVYFTMSTIFKKEQKSYWKKIWNEVKEISFSTDNFDVIYTVFVPNKLKLKINNKFGDLIIKDWFGELDVEMRHGDIRILDDVESVNVDQDYGDFHVRNINSLKMDNYNCRIDIKEVDSAILNTKGCKIKIHQINTLNIESKDDDLSIDELSKMYGKMKYSDFVINALDDGMDVTLKYSKLSVLSMTTNRPIIKIDQKYSETDLNVLNTNFKFNGLFEGRIPNLSDKFVKTSETIIDEKGNKIKIMGVYQKPIGSINIESDNSDFVLRD